MSYEKPTIAPLATYSVLQDPVLRRGREGSATRAWSSTAQVGGACSYSSLYRLSCMWCPPCCACVCVCVCACVCVCVCVCAPVQHKTHISLGSDRSVRRTTVQADFTSKAPQFVRTPQAHACITCTLARLMHAVLSMHSSYVSMYVCVWLPCAEGTGGSHKYP